MHYCFNLNEESIWSFFWVIILLNDAKWLREGQRKVKGRSREGQGRSKKDVRKVLQYKISGKYKRRSKKDVKKVLLCKI